MHTPYSAPRTLVSRSSAAETARVLWSYRVLIRLGAVQP